MFANTPPESRLKHTYIHPEVVHSIPYMHRCIFGQLSFTIYEFLKDDQ